MSLTPRVVALQGIEFTPIEIAVQGLLAFIAAGGTTGSRMRGTAKRRLEKIRDVRFRIGSAAARTTARGIPGRVTNLPAVVVVPQPYIAPLPLEPLPAPPPPLPVVVNIRTLARKTSARATARGLGQRASVRRGLHFDQACTVARSMRATAGGRVVLASCVARTSAQGFDDVYAEISASDEEIAILAANII